MQDQYQLLLKNLGGAKPACRDELVKRVSATKTALEAIDNKILSDMVTKAIDEFNGVLVAVNKLLQDPKILQAAKAAPKKQAPVTMVEPVEDVELYEVLGE